MHRRREGSDVTSDEVEVERGRAADRPHEIPARGWRDILVRTKDEAKADNITLLAAGVAFFGMLSLVPAMIATVSIYGLIADPSDIERQVRDLTDALPEEAQALISQQLSDVVRSSSSGLSFAAIAGVAVALWSASSGMKNLVRAINVAYDEPPRDSFVKARGLALALALGAIVFAVVALGLVAIMPAALSDIGLGSVARTTMSILRWPLLFVAMILGLAVLYRVAPNRADSQWRWVSWGAIAATTCWVVASILFSIYTANFGNYNETYGSLGAVILLLLWLFLTALFVVLGAELNAEMEHQTARDTTRGEPEPMGRRDAYVADRLGEPAR